MDQKLTMPNFIIVGAMRSGTTSMARWLGEHPDVFMAPNKEVHYFDRKYDRGRSWYASHFANASVESAVGEATPNYLYNEAALERIAHDLPTASVIILLRDPITRAFSHYHHRLSRGEEDLSFDDAIEAEQERLMSPDESIRAHYSYVDRGRYLNQVKRVLQLFSREDVLIQLFENLRDHPASTFAATARFLNVDATIVPEIVGRKTNGYQHFRSLALRSVTQRLPPAAGRLVGRLNRIDSDGYPPMPARARARLAEIYAPERDELASIIGRELDMWSV